MSLAVVVPSRGRPAAMTRLRDALKSTCTGDVSLFAGLDKDDPTLPSYPAGVDYTIRQDLRSVVPWINALAAVAAEKYPYVGMMGDDNIPRTVGWDERIIKALQETPFAFGNDLYPREQGAHPCHIFCRSGIIKALGYLAVPSLQHMFLDNAWMEWGKAVGITYLPDVIIEHLHFTVGKSFYDATYQASVKLWDSDQIAYNAYVHDSLAEDIKRMKVALEEAGELSNLGCDDSVHSSQVRETEQSPR